MCITEEITKYHKNIYVVVSFILIGTVYAPNAQFMTKILFNRMFDRAINIEFTCKIHTLCVCKRNTYVGMDSFKKKKIEEMKTNIVVCMFVCLCKDSKSMLTLNCWIMKYLNWINSPCRSNIFFLFPFSHHFYFYSKYYISRFSLKHACLCYIHITHKNRMMILLYWFWSFVFVFCFCLDSFHFFTTHFGDFLHLFIYNLQTLFAMIIQSNVFIVYRIRCETHSGISTNYTF